jgi:hypothetical protein
MNTYVIMKQRSSAIVRHEPQAHLVVGNLKEAKSKVIELNEKSMVNLYWYGKVKNTLEEASG